MHNVVGHGDIRKLRVENRTCGLPELAQMQGFMPGSRKAELDTSDTRE